jgi:hypothetical protein
MIDFSVESESGIRTALQVPIERCIVFGGGFVVNSAALVGMGQLR